MRVKQLEVYVVRLNLKRTVRHASYARRHTDNLVVRCRLDQGSEGWGEGVPREYVTGDTIESCLRLLEQGPLLKQLEQSFDNLREAVHVCERLDVLGGEKSPRSGFGNALKCAVELSVLDAVTRAFNKPLSVVAKLLPESQPLVTRQSKVQYSGVATLSSPLKQVLQTLLIRLYGFRHCKAKVGKDESTYLLALKRIRRVLGSRVDLRVDANEAWNAEELPQRLERLKKLNISCVEQPVPNSQIEKLSDIRGRLPVPVMLDESLCSLEDAHRAIERAQCDLFNIRLSKCGGFVASLKIAAAARAAGIGFQLGCQVGESGILSAAGRHFATTVAGLLYLEGSYDKYLVRTPLTQEDLTFGYGGWAPALAGPGLGVHIDTAQLEHCCLQRKSFVLE